MTPSIQLGSFAMNRVVCEFDELTIDVPHNRVLKAALGALIRHPEIQSGLAEELKSARARLKGVEELPFERNSFAHFSSHVTLDTTAR